MLITNNIHSQQMLNNRKEMLRNNSILCWILFCEWFVEKMLRK